VHFVDRLIRAEAACGGISQSEVATQLRVNIKDEGVDTEVRRAIPHDKGWFAVATCWQFKAVDAKDIDDKKKKTKKNTLQHEIHKPYTEELIKKGFGYRLCLLGDLTPKKLQEWESQLKAEAHAINPHAPDPRVIHGGHLIAWAERFPGIVAWFHDRTQGVFHWEAWQRNRRAVTPKYVPNGNWDGVRQQILEHVQFDRPCIGGDPCLFVGGAAGVGKTRLVFECLAELLQSSALVLIVEDEQEAKKIGIWLANADKQFAIVVADECSPQSRYFLNENLRGHVHRVRVISIDNTGDRLASTAARLLLSAPDALKNAEAILEANFEHVPNDRRRQYAQLSGGFIRLAADLCEHDAEVGTGEMAGVLTDIERYARQRLGNNLNILCVIALFHKVGFREDVIGELEVLRQLTGYSRQDFHDCVRATRESPGFVVQAGRYWYVTPEIIARVLFNEGWLRWVAPDLEGFLKKLPDEMRQQLVDRVATHARKEIRDQCASFFRAWFSRLAARDLAGSTTTSLAAAIVEASPGEYLPKLRRVIEAANVGDLKEMQPLPYDVRWGPRRTLVWLLERLVSFPEFFEDCEACLFRLALEESEPQLGNNATAIWSNLFSVFFSGTAIPFDQRVPILAARVASPIIAEARLGFLGLANALQRPFAGHIIGEPVVAGRLRPQDWQPTRREERVSYQFALTICGEHLKAEVQNERHRLAFKVLSGCLYLMLKIGLADELRRIATPEILADDEARKLLQIVDDFLEQEGTSRTGEVDERTAAYKASIEEWGNKFRRTDFSGRLREVCAREPWDQRFAQDATKDRDETDNLAAVILNQPTLLSAEMDWLASPDAQSAERLGFAIGRIDEVGDCGHQILEHAILRKTAPLLRGYIRGMTYAQRPPNSDFRALMTSLESAHPELATDILVHAGDNFDALNRILRLVESRAVSEMYLTSLAGGLGRRRLTAEEVDRVLPYFTRAANKNETRAVVAGLRFLATQLMFESGASVQKCLSSTTTQSLAWHIVESALPLLSGNETFAWITILKSLAACDSNRASGLLAQALLSENSSLRDAAENDLTHRAKTDPDGVMAGLGYALLDPERGWRLQIHRCRGLLAKLPGDIVIDWVRKHGQEGARAIARHLPAPYIDETGTPVVPQALDVILSEYDDDDVFGNFLGGSHSDESWNGNGAEEFRQAAEIAKKFLGHRNHRIREWAENEIAYRLVLAEREDQEHEERLLPL
jgi:hypothetical protein